MATSSPSATAGSPEQPPSSSQPTDIPQVPHQSDDVPSSTPLEMSSLHATAPIADTHTAETTTTGAATIPAASEPPQTVQDASKEAPADPTDDTTNTSTELKSDTAAPASTANPPIAPSFSRKESSAIGPDTDGNIAPFDIPSGPAVLITLLLISGARHPYRIDEAYLKKRNVASADDAAVDPFTISIYTMKELIWRDWRAEWETRPSSPGSIRLIHFGKLLDDKAALRDYFKPDMPNVVHMSVRPQDFADEEETGKAGPHREHDEGDEQPGCCRCVIM